MNARRLDQALRAGTAAYAAAVLLAALLAAPLVVGDSFGHRHADGGATHVHPITQLLPGRGVVETHFAAPTWTLLLTLAPAVSGVMAARPESTTRSRAPPAAF